MNLPNFDTNHFTKFLVDLLNIPSPTGFAEPAIAFVEKELSQYQQLELSRTRKGALVAKWTVESDLPPVALTAHVDTLGAVVKEIKSSGRLKLSRIGGVQWPTIETEGVWVFTSKGEKIRGSVLIDNASGHIFGGTDTPRNDDHMEVRLDARTTSEKETRELGINVGDCVAFDPRVEVTNGFIRSRFLDDKACVANVVAAIKSLAESGRSPKRSVYFHISNYEEVGHGASAGIPSDVAELVTVDMAVVGAGQESDEFSATLCIKDSGGVYHEGLNKKLRAIAEKHGIAYKTDVYPLYGSDGEAFWRAGGDVALALIGPGIDASHNYERAHMDGLNATTNWIMAYLID
ncbi:MAG: M42 family metallopeptidase [Anaerolineae bacterium]|nr:M42 family metallopeptidase [Anaerolineae bacterium]MBL8104796.1 M42 family metallopeptidase [Anaerolineales bacterium]MCC7188438.1 M42 family metallopeptidase [Anaerolineales bacterium]